jgi:hypothetical protein
MGHGYRRPWSTARLRQIQPCAELYVAIDRKSDFLTRRHVVASLGSAPKTVATPPKLILQVTSGPP